MKKTKKSIISLLFLLICLIVPYKAYAVGYDGNGTKLDASIYWYGKNNAAEKFVEGQSNPYFDPKKPTIIYIHGWQKDSTTKLYRESFNPSTMDREYGVDVNLADYWIDKGWNVGIFYWNQFSDESEVKDAEAKIWTTSGPKSMRWRKVDGTYESNNVPTVSVAQLFVDNYKKAMSNFSGSEIRLAGHSLGGQVVINGTKLISDEIDKNNISSKLLPNRVALLDPFWSKNSKSYLNNKWTGEVSRSYVTNLKSKGVVFEQYKTSNINSLLIGDSNNDMKKLTDFTEIHPDFISILNESSKHRYARDWYFYSFGFDAPKETKNNQSTGNAASSASTSTSREAIMMNSNYYWIQSYGTNTYTPLDDKFEITSR
ncbi:hypothetical protein CLPUN_29380 [Clostridium puniceum]|uniref:Alpha/beta hydrolase family protein n=1 Tax=Clostridium puniceum TaxID=29367 RepID=A0A1S8TE37_9CLOT|nr:Ig domain-containing protein [Clostridium puniceum]OOM75901.1 hypothetical protein CLPUN_29380 [Clostridium puniceum]